MRTIASSEQKPRSAPTALALSSPAFGEGQMLPREYTCDGEAVNPELDIGNVPPQAKSLALIVDDPDAQAGLFTHWLVYDIPVVARIERASIPGRQGMNSSGTMNYAGPCPPSGTHHYRFHLYALDTVLGLDEGARRSAVEKALQGHVLAEAYLTGLYRRAR